MMRQTQSGSTLVISMIMLVVLMLLGVMAMVTSNTSYKLAGNLQFENNALNNAEAALSVSENSLLNGTVNYLHADFFAASTVTAATSGLYPKGDDVIEGLTWADADSLDVSPDNDGTQRRIVQLMSTETIQVGESLLAGMPQSTVCQRVNTYRITTRGTSARGATKFVRSYYSVLTVC